MGGDTLARDAHAIGPARSPSGRPAAGTGARACRRHDGADIAEVIRQVNEAVATVRLQQAALERSTTPLACPADWQPLDENDDRERCYGSANRSSFFGAGLVNAARAARL